jgi:hypothetical protein
LRGLQRTADEILTLEPCADLPKSFSLSDRLESNKRLGNLAPQMNFIATDALFTLDGFHDPALAAASAGSYFDRMRRAFRARGQALGYEVIDVDPFFFDHLHQTGEPGNFPHDFHWNATGHGVAAAAILSSGFLDRIERK